MVIGPMNAASQGTLWSSAIRRTGKARCWSLSHDGPVVRQLRPNSQVTLSSDKSLPHYRLTPYRYRRHVVKRIVEGSTHVLNEGNLPFASNPHTTSFFDEVRAGIFRDVTLGVVFHGTDARDPKLAKQLDASSYFFDADEDWVKVVASRAQRNRRQIEDLGLPTFVTTPDMLRHVRGSQLLPITVDAASWVTSSPPFRGVIPRVLHRSSGNPFTKGSKYIIPALEALRDAGRIELVTPPVVRHASMRALIRSSDIVIDQLQSGTYGVTGLEAMAAGRLVVANISAHSEIGTPRVPPVFDASPSNFASRMNELLDSPGLMSLLASEGPSYVSSFHSSEVAARVLLDFMKVK